MSVPRSGPVPVMIIAAILVVTLIALGVSAIDVRQILGDFSGLAALYVLHAASQKQRSDT